MAIRSFELSSVDGRRLTKPADRWQNLRVDHNSTVTLIVETSPNQASVDFRFTANYRAAEAVIGLIQLDGADGLLVHYLRGERPADVEGDLRLRAVFKPRARRRGSILDIQGFRPVT